MDLFHQCDAVSEAEAASW